MHAFNKPRLQLSSTTTSYLLPITLDLIDWLILYVSVGWLACWLFDSFVFCCYIYWILTPFIHSFIVFDKFVICFLILLFHISIVFQSIHIFRSYIVVSIYRREKQNSTIPLLDECGIVEFCFLFYFPHWNSLFFFSDWG